MYYYTTTVFSFFPIKHVSGQKKHFTFLNPATNEDPVIVVEEIEPVVFQLCGETAQDLNKAHDIINLLITKEQMNITICDSAICHCTDEDVEMLSAIETELKVSVRLEKKHHVITLKGLAGQQKVVLRT